jgi:Ca-activated chloride channel homolog
VLTNPTLKFTGDVRTTKLYPSPLPDLFKGEQLVLVGRYSGKGDSAVIVQGSVNGAERKFTYEVKFPAESDECDFIPRLWATRRVGYLLDEIRLHGENSELRDEVTELARKYCIVTPYTAYLILEDETQRNVPVRMRSLQNFEADGMARQQARAAWNDFKQERDGDRAVGGARYGLALKDAVAAAPAASSGALESRRALGLPTAPASVSEASSTDRSKEKLVQYSQQAQFVAGKNFFQNDKQWVDSAVQKHPKATQVRIQFGSPEYFQLIAKQAEVLPWLALGQNVQFIFNNTLYDIYE